MYYQFCFTRVIGMGLLSMLLLLLLTPPAEGSTGSGPPLLVPSGIAVEPTGGLAILDSGQRAVLRIDPGSGDRTQEREESHRCQ